MKGYCRWSVHLPSRHSLAAPKLQVVGPFLFRRVADGRRQNAQDAKDGSCLTYRSESGSESIESRTYSDIAYRYSESIISIQISVFLNHSTRTSLSPPNAHIPHYAARPSRLCHLPVRPRLPASAGPHSPVPYTAHTAPPVSSHSHIRPHPPLPSDTAPNTPCRPVGPL